LPVILNFFFVKLTQCFDIILLLKLFNQKFPNWLLPLDLRLGSWQSQIWEPAYAHEYPLFVVETKKDIVGNESQVHMHVWEICVIQLIYQYT